jgi:hypothetical protein
VKFINNPLLIICASMLLSSILLLLFYKIRKKIGVSLGGVLNFTIALIIGGAVMIPVIFILGENYLTISIVLGLLFVFLTFVLDKNL